jgi:threonine synthase
MKFRDQHERQYLLADGGRRPVDVATWCGPDGEPLRLEPGMVGFDRASLGRGPKSLWRYRRALPFSEDSPWPGRTTMGEGMTPLVPVTWAGGTVYAKFDHLMPTLSFKDRGAAVIVAKAAELGAPRIVADSSGNAGTAIAAYAARVRIPCEIFVPAATSPAKTTQIVAHGATLVRVDGTREDTAAAAIDRLGDGGAFYASHVYNPLFLEGTKTYAFEIWESIGVPDVIVVPVGNGTMLLGAMLGFDELLLAGLADRRPHVIAVQSAACNPIERAFRDEATDGGKQAAPTIAEGIAIAAPARGPQIVDALRSANATMAAVDDEQVVRACSELASAGAAWAAIDALGRDRLSSLAEVADPVVVAPICGAGLKTAAH